MRCREPEELTCVGVYAVTTRAYRKVTFLYFHSCPLNLYVSRFNVYKAPRNITHNTIWCGWRGHITILLNGHRTKNAPHAMWFDARYKRIMSHMLCGLPRNLAWLPSTSYTHDVVRVYTLFKWLIPIGHSTKLPSKRLSAMCARLSNIKLNMGPNNFSRIYIHIAPNFIISLIV